MLESIGVYEQSPPLVPSERFELTAMNVKQVFE